MIEESLKYEPGSQQQREPTGGRLIKFFKSKLLSKMQK